MFGVGWEYYKANNLNGLPNKKVIFWRLIRL